MRSPPPDGVRATPFTSEPAPASLAIAAPPMRARTLGRAAMLAPWRALLALRTCLRDRRELRGFGEHMLRDIGLSRDRLSRHGWSYLDRPW